MPFLTQHTLAAPSAARCRNCIIMDCFQLDVLRWSLYDGNTNKDTVLFLHELLKNSKESFFLVHFVVWRSEADMR